MTLIVSLLHYFTWKDIFYYFESKWAMKWGQIHKNCQKNQKSKVQFQQPNKISS